MGSRCGTFTLGGFVGLSGLPPATLPLGLVILLRRSNALDESLWSRGSSINEEIDVFLEEVDVALLVVVVCADDDRLGSAGCKRSFAWRTLESRIVECLVWITWPGKSTQSSSGSDING